MDIKNDIKDDDEVNVIKELDSDMESGKEWPLIKVIIIRG